MTLPASMLASQARKDLRRQARAYLQQAKQLGSQEPLLDSMLAAIPAYGSGGGQHFSDNPAVERSMEQAESAFNAGNFPIADSRTTGGAASSSSWAGRAGRGPCPA